MAIDTIEFPAIAPPRRLPRADGLKVVSTTVGARGEAIRLLVSSELVEQVFAYYQQPGGAAFPETHTDIYTAIVSISGDGFNQEIRLPEITATFPLIESLPDQSILVLAARCAFNRNSGPERNARIYDRDGRLEREFCLGDGIEHVQADTNGNIWVGYFDEGVFGNFGWGFDGPVPTGAAGLVCFDRCGNPLWEYSPPEGFEPICDCYALNVAEDAVWTSYYSQFPLVRINSDRNIQGWALEDVACKTFAVSGERLLMYGGYQEEQTSCKLVRLIEDKAVVEAKVLLAFPKKVDLARARVVGRDRLLHVFVDDDWYSFSAESTTLGSQS